MVPNSGTKTELSISRKGSSWCMGSTSAKAIETTASSVPQARRLRPPCRLWAETEPEYRSP